MPHRMRAMVRCDVSLPIAQAREVLDFYGAMAGVPRKERKQRIPELLDLVGMGDWAGKRIKQYSKGMRQRVGLAQALMNKPELVLLDEPTDGVDPVGRKEIRGICQRLRDDGMTVFINSHLLSELEMVCDRVAILVQGLVSSQGTIDELTSDQRRYQIDLTSPGALEAAALAAAARFPAGTDTDPARNRLTIPTADPEAIQPIIDALRQQGHTIAGVHAHRPSLEDLFMQAVTDPTTGQALTPGASREKAPRGGKGARP